MSTHPLLRSVSRHRGSALRDGTASAMCCRGHVRAYGKERRLTSCSASVPPVLAMPVQLDDSRKTSASAVSAAPASTSSSAASAAAICAKGSRYGAFPTAVAAADVLLSLNHTQRLLRRLPVGASRFLFHYNELPSNIRDKMPLVVQQQQRHRAPTGSKEEGHATNTAASTPLSASDSGALASMEINSVRDAQVRRSGSAEYLYLLTLSQPPLTASEKTLFALFRGAQKERQLVRLQRLASEGSGRQLSAAPPPATPRFTDPLLHGLAVDVRPTDDTPSLPTPARATAACAANAAALSPSPPSTGVPLASNAAGLTDTVALDAFHLGLECISTDYRTDFASLPLHYVLGVPAALMELLRSDPSISHPTLQQGKRRNGVRYSTAETWRTRSQTPVDLSRWLVFDTATSQMLLRRRGAARSDEPLVSTLEAQVFLAQTYSFDPRSAYEAAALQARVPAPPSASTAGSIASLSTATPSTETTTSAPFYNLFFFTVARGHAATNTRVSPIDAGVLYPSCFFSYMTEVPTTQQLAVEAATVAASAAQCPHFPPAADLPSSALVSSATGAGTAGSSSFFVSMSGKRLRVCADASSSKAAHLWTAQLQSRKLGGIADGAAAPSSPFEKGAGMPGYRVEMPSAAPMCEGERDSWRQTSVRQKMSESFRVWREAVAARLPSPSSRTSTGTTASVGHCGDSHAQPPKTDGQQRSPASASHAEHPRHMSKPTTPVPGSPAPHEEGRGEGRRSPLEEQLDAEFAALMCDGGALHRDWSSGVRFGRVAIAVAVPLLFPMPNGAADEAAAPCPWLAAHRGTRVGGADEATDAAVRVADAPLADALWSALYTPVAAPSGSPTAPFAPFGTPSSFLSSKMIAATKAVVPPALPMAEDRLMLARERVLLPFLLHQPRWVLPSLGSPVLDTGSGQRSACKRSGPLPVTVCPSLWRLDELEQLCGWRRHRLPFKDAFGSFSSLLIRDLYTLLGREIPAMLSGAVPAMTWTAGQTDGQQTPLSPVVLFNDVAYVENVLLPAMRCFAANSCTWVESGLCVYRSPYEVLPAEARHEVEDDFTVCKKSGTSSLSCRASQRRCSQASREDEPADSPAETAVEVALHHRQLSLWLQQLQRTQHKLLRRWLAACHGRTCLDPELDARVRRKTGGVPAACLAFFIGSFSRAPSTLSSRASSAPCDGDDDDLDGRGAVAASATAVENGLERLLSLTPDRIAVVPLLDFVVWGALCSDFSAASVEHLTQAAGWCRATLDAPADGLAAVKYCVRYPRHFCCDGGRGTTVALLR
ncbi:hypothetical protein LSCM4_04779 [Leishmania orientalis]|uniref:Uncharacterized protein n=1 Tax=Leishmania orientalis TaxID=2249476 RepID=A0A836GNT5_9TRYP|nr:hypothetical protein LSCM4_04779 [Leishmania orientalis]